MQRAVCREQSQADSKRSELKSTGNMSNIPVTYSFMFKSVFTTHMDKCCFPSHDQFYDPVTLIFDLSIPKTIGTMAVQYKDSCCTRLKSVQKFHFIVLTHIHTYIIIYTNRGDYYAHTVRTYNKHKHELTIPQ